MREGEEEEEKIMIKKGSKKLTGNLALCPTGEIRRCLRDDHRERK